ncbi:D-tyrosyl-tRNA(Tyr) deacylase [Microbotryomycetes sp. JL201]|nr:D-tyrosyl-tRNA(Tyr) deacylase [Microbotryomycetes sp. JL201]
MALVGITTSDTSAELEWLATKLLNLKLFPQGDDWGWKSNVVEAKAQVLCADVCGGMPCTVSQFTLYANCKKGSKPDFHAAMPGDQSKKMYHDFLTTLRKQYDADKIFDGEFGKMMDVALVNDGPVTIILDSAVDAPKSNDSDKNAEKLKRKQEAERLAVEKQNRRDQAAFEQAEKQRRAASTGSAPTHSLNA